jgi:hypothetical protein
MKNANRVFLNKTRKQHSWVENKNGEILTPREVHKTGDSAPKKGSKEWEKEKNRMKEKDRMKDKEWEKEKNRMKEKDRMKEIRKQNRRQDRF